MKSSEKYTNVWKLNTRQITNRLKKKVGQKKNQKTFEQNKNKTQYVSICGIPLKLYIEETSLQNTTMFTKKKDLRSMTSFYTVTHYKNKSK